jgi:catechol 2,3-dioxygenase-like lactoylglutathione lyase family enzyme
MGRAFAFGAALFGAKTAMAASPGLPPAPTVLNIGLNVADIERSLQFYTKALGFEDAGVVVSDPPNGATVFFGRNGADYLKKYNDVAKLRVHHARMGGVMLLLREFQNPKYVGTTDVPPTHQLGMCNISVRVDSIERVSALVRQYGGHVFEGTWVKKGTKPGNGGAGMIFGADPDGIQIELVEI